MSFLRSSQGISNYPAFYGVDFCVFTEGRKNFTDTNDELFYEAILRLSTNKTFKIKTVGNCTDAMTYFDMIKNQNLNNFLVFIDKDLNEFNRSIIIDDHRLILTYGYSWESDFWSIPIIKKILEILGRATLGQKDIEKIEKCIRSAHTISSLDTGAQLFGKKIIDKNTGTGGINFSKSKCDCNVIHKDEIYRLSKLYQSVQTEKCNIVKDTIKNCMKSEPIKVIQGHLLEKIFIHILIRNIKRSTNSRISSNIILNTAFHLFSNQTDTLLQPQVKHHYLHKTQRFITKSGL